MKMLRLARNVSGALAGAVCFTLAVCTAGQAQDSDRLSLAVTNPGYDRAKSAEILAADFAGAWRVKLANDAGAPIEGRAEIAADGSGATLSLDGPQGTERYESIEAEGLRFAPGTGLARGALVIRFGRIVETPADPEANVKPLIVPRSRQAVTFRVVDGKGDEDASRDRDLSLPVEWNDDARDRLRVSLQRYADPDRLEGAWSEERTGDLRGGGGTLWLRGAPRIDGIIVLDDQSRPEARYPFKPDGTPIEGASTTRSLLVYGKHLPPTSDFAEVHSPDRSIGYAFDPENRRGREEAIAAARKQTARVLESANGEARAEATAALESRMEALKDGDAELLEAVIVEGALPGSKELVVGEARGAWPMLFSDQNASLKLVRPEDFYGSDPTPVYYVGDAGAVELEFKTFMPYDEIGVTIMRRASDAQDGESAQEIGVLAAKLVDDSDQIETYRTEPIRFAAPGEATAGTATDDERVVLPVSPGDVIGAKLFDPHAAFTQPLVALAQIYGDPSELGPLWKQALRRVAACNGDPPDGDELYALRTSTRLSRFVIGEFLMQTASYVSPLALAAVAASGSDGPVDFNPSVNVLNGDHAAAILIRDELVEFLLSQTLIEPLSALALNERGEVEALRAQAREAGNPQSVPLLANYSGVWNVTWSSNPVRRALTALGVQGVNTVEISLAETLDTGALAERLGTSPQKAEEWAVGQTEAAAARFLDAIRFSIGRVQEAGDCDLEELLIVAGQKADPAVARILPRLVKKKAGQWVPDKLAQGFVKRLHIVGAASRALEEYGDIDDAYKAMALAVASAGFGAAASGAGYAGLATYGMLAADAADMLYFGVKGVNNYLAAEDYYQYTLGGVAAFGNEAVAEAESMREAGVMAGVGLIAPGFSSLANLKHLRNLKNVQKGKALFQQSGAAALDDLTKLSDAERAQMAAYYTDILAKAKRGGVDGLSESDRLAYGAFQRYFDSPDAVPRTGPGGTAMTDVPHVVSEAPRPPPPESSSVFPSSSTARLPSPDRVLPPINAPPGTLPIGSRDEILVRFKDQIAANGRLDYAPIRGSRHFAPDYPVEIRRVDDSGTTWKIGDKTYRLGEMLNDVGDEPGRSSGLFADVYNVVDEAGMPAPYVAKKFGERRPWLRFDQNHPLWPEQGAVETSLIKRDPKRKDVARMRWPSLSSEAAEHLEMVDDIEHGAGMLERANIPQLELYGVRYDGDTPVVFQRRLDHEKPEGIVAERMPSEVFQGLGAKNWRDSELKPYRKAYLELRKKMAESDIVWEDGHSGNFFYQVTDRARIRAAILDTDRMGIVGNTRPGRQPKGWFDIMAKEWRQKVGRPINRESAKELTVASLLHKGYIGVNESGNIAAGLYPVEEVRAAFPILDEMMLRPRLPGR